MVADFEVIKCFLLFLIIFVGYEQMGKQPSGKSKVGVFWTF